MTIPMLAYHNDPKLKQTLLAQLQAHYDADEIVKGIYWQHGKGCAVGCILHSDDHSLFPTRLGIPEAIAYLIDVVFEGLPNQNAKEWPLKVMSAIPVGADLFDVTRQFLLRILSDEEKGCLRYTQEGSSKYKIISMMLSLLEEEGKYLRLMTALGETTAVGMQYGRTEAREVAEVAQEAAWMAARAGAEEEHYPWMADTLLTLLKQAPVPQTTGNRS